MKKLFVKLMSGLILFFSSTYTMAYWAEKSDTTLINEADIIVYAQYQGASVLKSSLSEGPVHLGILKPTRILKGAKNQEVFFLKLYNPDAPISSDMLFFKVNQTGLWFLKLVPGSKGLYQVTHPSQFKDIPESEIKHWQTLLK